MKKWTVMLIPHDRGGSRTLTLSSWHFWLAVLLLATLTFSSAFLFQRHRAIARKADDLRRANRALELENARRQTVTEPLADEPTSGGDATTEDVREVEAKLREEYEASIGAITTELNRLYDMETKAREATGLAPKGAKAQPKTKGQSDGRGGPAGTIVPAISSAGVPSLIRPAKIIYGMSQPPADLILQEIRLRASSLEQLVRDVKALQAQKEQVARVPSVWPLAGGAGRISSTFGYRRDPFSKRVSYHSAVDISSPVGTQIKSTASGVVVYAGYDGDYGNVVRIDHGNGTVTCYAHLARMSVRNGQRVERGAVLGSVGMTGRTTGPHLHYEVRIKGKPVDPAKYLD